ncbi:DNA-processing protein DprA [Amycolatopsis suaedae]|uniref:DNA-protecting protein DprA n=1 Tax=Amycolatopsis suaedae TaxID=2510978 RepID=A0A4V2EME7_9PSEU|nr:DNA-processing protein DprA [Amycolatopsis suaedae]RZQ64805.1 DNA-protecting protein DprA [Amycolatopsis suaedae]
MTAAADEVRLARAYLMRVAEPPAVAVGELVENRGPVQAAALVRDGKCPPAARAETEARAHLDQAAQDLELAARSGARLVVPEDDEWPAWPLLSMWQAVRRGVKALAPPLGLWVRGSPPLADAVQPGVAVVGARACSGYGRHTATELARALVTQGIPVVSGAAHGIDAAAHRGALAGGGPTVAVLACGIDTAYPAGHGELLDRVAGLGAVVSEYAPGVPPARHRFLVRNRLIAALSDGTVVVEAGARSGSRNTAATAGALGKVVMAVPGPVDAATSVGCHELIRSAAATLVASTADVLETVGRFGEAHPGRPRPRRLTDSLGPEALRVHEALPARGGYSAERVAVDSGVPIARVRAVLPALELDGLSVRCEAGWRRGRKGAVDDEH